MAKLAKLKSKRRLTPGDREQEIVDEAVQFFAEVGFDGKTRDLAKRIGITQPLLYRYFPTKDDLIERVYKEVYLNQMDSDWSLNLKNRSVPLEERLINYYKSYAKVVHRYEWIRIYFFSGLEGNPLNRRYIRVVEEEILKPICEEIRVACDLPPLSEVPLSPIELERVWVMHGGLFYYAVRKNIFHSNVLDDFEAIVTSTVKIMLEGVKTFSIEEINST